MIRRVHAMMAKGTYIQHLQAERGHVYAVLYRGLYPTWVTSYSADKTHFIQAVVSGCGKQRESV